jgi:hypothetical protein
MTLTANGPTTARSRPARLATDIRATLCQSIALATASQREPDLTAWLAAMLGTLPRGQGDLLAAVLTAAPGGSR